MKDRLKTQLIRHEDLRLKPYMCPAGKMTIGVGRNIEDRGITKSEAMLLLDNDIDMCEEQLNDRIKDFQHYPDDVKLVLMNMCFNLGINRLLGFRKTLKNIADGEYVKASSEMLKSRWAKQVKRRAQELSRILKNVNV